MTCPLCNQPLTEQIDSHHDHLQDVAVEEFRSLRGPSEHNRDGHLVDRLQRSNALKEILRFSEPVEICQPCNTLEGAWKKDSNQRGFLPIAFSLKPDEIARIRRMGLDHSHPEVQQAIYEIWKREESEHSRRVMQVKQVARDFCDSLP